MASLSSRGSLTTLLLLVLMACSSFATCGATRDWQLDSSRAGKKGKSGHGNHGHPKPKPKPCSTPKPKPKPSPTPQPSPSPSPPPPQGGGMFNVLDYGADGDGVNDDTKLIPLGIWYPAMQAFQAAWAAACDGAPSKVIVPSNFEFLVGPISFSGPCKSNVVFQVDGKIIAPSSGRKAWSSDLLQWLEFRGLKGIRIEGQGIIEGQGSAWWSSSSSLLGSDVSEQWPHVKPTALRFYGSSDVTVSGITVRNSPQVHLKFDSCQAVEVTGVTISSPGDSPNTDGIHLQNSVNVFIHNTDLSCGDDCISIQTGCSNILVQNVNCGPGHGISIGGLGKADTQASVSNVTVQNANIVGTMTGVRIKTWQGGSGFVKCIRFAKIKVSKVKTPIVIDQFYCDHRDCKNQTSAVALSDIAYDGIVGTYTVQPVYLACSDGKPCRNIHLSDIQLQLLKQRGRTYDRFCWQAYGDLRGPAEPPITCLRTNNTI
ncbi:Glycosyl hydrolases family 28 [Musa troglodytarum]|uniref:Glycosyl hydrolases family 28 n=1 Tax=Musa troglodytarum TaxID=320322 RepID=A0A9E7FMJ6_9LILI|nr:Glycosyl hydrolases family 28 [Musa troglodytarum]